VTRRPLTRAWTHRHTVRAGPAQTRANFGDIVTTEGGGFSPTLELGGGAGFDRVPSAAKGTS
jgi:hypothetical protein